jgi:hypothetical protein
MVELASKLRQWCFEGSVTGRSIMLLEIEHVLGCTVIPSSDFPSFVR